jgi:hypothetical protein
LLGADNKIAKKADLEELKEGETVSFTTGYYYSKAFRYQTYKPELIETD